MNRETLRALLAAKAAGRTVVLATRLEDGAQWIFPDQDLPERVARAAAGAVATGQTGHLELGAEGWFLHVHAPSPRLLVIGAVHIAQALVPLANAMGIAVTIIDPRPAYNTAERIVGADRVQDWPDRAIARLGLDGRTAMVALAHDPKLDDPALDLALRSPAFFIGVLGSRKSQAARLIRLAALGHDAASLARVRGPVGLAIGALTAPEIALSIVAEIVAARRGSRLAVRD